MRACVRVSVRIVSCHFNLLRMIVSGQNDSLSPPWCSRSSSWTLLLRLAALPPAWSSTREFSGATGQVLHGGRE